MALARLAVAVLLRKAEVLVFQVEVLVVRQLLQEQAALAVGAHLLLAVVAQDRKQVIQVAQVALLILFQAELAAVAAVHQRQVAALVI
jgi:hypothetical protein